jgi:hypothetical protein
MSNEISDKVIQEIQTDQQTCRSTLRLTREEHDFLIKVRRERGCSVNAYIRWLIKRRMYECSENEGQLFEVKS